MNALPSFDFPGLADAVQAMSTEQRDLLPFGVIGLDLKGMTRAYNKTEARRSGYKSRPALERDFFVTIAPCMNNSYFKGRIDDARRAGKLDIRFTFVGDFNDSERELTVRVQAAADGGTWIFIQRPPDGETC